MFSRNPFLERPHSTVSNYERNSPIKKLLAPPKKNQQCRADPKVDLAKRLAKLKQTQASTHSHTLTPENERAMTSIEVVLSLFLLSIIEYLSDSNIFIRSVWFTINQGGGVRIELRPCPSTSFLRSCCLSFFRMFNLARRLKDRRFRA